MNIDSLLRPTETIANAGITLNTEESIILYNSLVVLQNENHFRNIFFWGKILGSIFYYSRNGMDWGLLPPPTKYAKIFAQLVSSQFQGDPSIVVEVLCEKDDPISNKIFGEVNVMKKLKEEDRLSATVQMITEEVWIVPRGALFKRHDGVIIENKAFEGLCDLDAREKKSYLHFREPRQKWNINLLTRKDYNYAIDFFDTIQPDIPDDTWTLKLFEGIHVVIKSLHWPGLTFYHRVGKLHYGCAYFGNGRRNIDISFMV